MNQDTKKSIVLALISLRITNAFPEPNTRASQKVAARFARSTGESELILHRFHNAVINNNVHNSFGEKGFVLARLILKEHMREMKFLPNPTMRGDLGKFANNNKLSFNDVLEVVREIYCEIISEELEAQSRA